MSLFGFAIAAALSSAESCTVVRREQGAFNAQLFARLARLNQASRRPDGSQRPPTATERREFAAIETEVEAFIARYNERLSNCRKD